MVCKCFQGDRNGFLSFDYTVDGLVEPHMDGHCKGNRQSCMTILMWADGDLYTLPSVWDL